MARQKIVGLVLCLAASLITCEASAQYVSKEEILRKLVIPKQEPLTRGFKPLKRGIDVDQTANMGGTGTSTYGSNSVAGPNPGVIPNGAVATASQAAASAGRIDLRVTFKLNSAELTEEAKIQLRALADALADDSMAHSRVLIAGHTDASGSSDYNLALSRKRAASVRDFLVYYSGIEPRRLEAVGYGETKLLDQHQPQSSRNRRVEIINMGT
jgi:OOP family OmpA-OmpF porin